MFGKILFVSQLMAMLLCAFPLTMRWPLPLTLIFWASASILLLWVIRHNRLGNWSVFPQPKESGHLIEKGPYRWMRHPMYTAIMLGAIGFILHNQTLQSIFSLLGLILILNIKARYEEKLLNAHFPNYQHYLDKVHCRFVPKLPFRKLS